MASVRVPGDEDWSELMQLVTSEDLVLTLEWLARFQVGLSQKAWPTQFDLSLAKKVYSACVNDFDDGVGVMVALRLASLNAFGGEGADRSATANMMMAWGAYERSDVYEGLVLLGDVHITARTRREMVERTAVSGRKAECLTAIEFMHHEYGECRVEKWSELTKMYLE